MASQEKPILTYKASDMVLAIHSNASYLFEPKARSRAGGHMFMSTNDDIPKNSRAILNISQIIRAVMSSAAEAELGALFINAKTVVSMRHTLKELDIPNRARQFRRITKPQTTYSPIKSCQRRLKPCTCDSTGYAAATLRDNLDIIGDRAHRT